MQGTMYDVAIVGGGPAGVNAALLLGRARRRTLLCDVGRPRNAVSHTMHGFLSRDGADPAEVRRIGREQLAQYDAVEVRDDEVLDVSRSEAGFVITPAGGDRATARRLLLATGMRDELPPIEGLTALWGRGTFPCPYCDGWEVRDQPLLALGSGMAGALFALLLSKWSGDVTLCTHGPAQLDEQARALLASRGVSVREDEILRVQGMDSGVEVVFASGDPIRRRALFAHPALRQATELPERLGCEVTEDSPRPPAHGIDHDRRGALPGSWSSMPAGAPIAATSAGGRESRPHLEPYWPPQSLDTLPTSSQPVDRHAPMP